MPITINGTGTISGVSATGLTTAQTVSASNITTGTLPIAQGGTGTTLGSAIVPISVVQLSGLTQFNFSVAAYPQYVIYMNNIGGSVASANMILSASADGGSTYVGSWNYSQFTIPTNGASTSFSNGGSSSAAPVWTDIWNGAAPSGTNGYILIAGTSYYGANKRLSFSSVFAGQTQNNQGTQISMGQEQDDGKQFNNVKIYLGSGTFYGNSTALICGIKAF